MLIFDLVFSGLLALALYFFIKYPVHKNYESPSWIDPLIGFTLTFCVLIYFYLAHYSARLTPESATSPCGQLSLQIECYNVSTETCMSAWNNSRGDCDEKMEAIRKERPAALLGTLLETCIGRNFDQAMKYNRKNENTPACRAYFSKMQGQ